MTIEENPVDVVNRKKMELRAWNVRDMPLQYNESEETAFEKQLKAMGRSDVKVLRIDIKHGPKDDFLRDECFFRIQRLVNSGRCIGVWMAPACSTWSSLLSGVHAH